MKIQIFAVSKVAKPCDFASKLKEIDFTTRKSEYN